MCNQNTPVQIIAKTSETPDYSPAAVKALTERFGMNERGFGLLMNVTPSIIGNAYKPMANGDTY